MQNVSYFEIFRRRWLALVVAVLLGTGSAALIAFTIPPTYSATATLFLVVDDPDASLAERSQFSLARVNSYTDLVRSSEVLEPVIDDLELDLTVQELSSQVSASNPSNTVNIEIRAVAGAASTAADIANAVADSLSRLVSRVENVAAFSVTLERLIPALTPTSPSAPQKAVIIGLGVLSGLAGGAVAALLLARFDRRIRSLEDVRRATGLPVLGAFPRAHHRDSGGETGDGVDPSAIEALARIAQLNGGGMPRVLLLVPAEPDAGSPRVRVQLAGAVGATGRRALLVEPRPANAEHAALRAFAAEPGLAELLTGSEEFSQVVRRMGEGPTSVLPAGLASPSEAEAQSSFRAVMTGMLASADVVITQVEPADHPVSLPVVAPHSDVPIVVVRFHRTTDLELSRAVSQLRIAGVRPLGVLLVEVPRSARLDLLASWGPDDIEPTPRKPLIVPRRAPAPRKTAAG